jgi:hypothetical protein
MNLNAVLKSVFPIDLPYSLLESDIEWSEPSMPFRSPAVVWTRRTVIQRPSLELTDLTARSLSGFQIDEL